MLLRQCSAHCLDIACRSIVFAGMFMVITAALCSPTMARPSWHFEAVRGDNELVGSDANLKLRRFIVYRLSRPKEKFNLIWAVIPLDAYRLRLQAVNSQQILPGLKQCPGDLAITGGFSEGSKSKGWVVSDGQTISPEADFNGGGAFIVSKGVAQIIRKTEIAQSREVDLALQSTPILIFDEKYDGASEEIDSWNRAGIGVTVDGKVIVALVYGPKNSLADFGRLLADLSDAGHSSKIKAMIGLDSRVTGTFLIRKNGAHFGAEGDTFTPNIFCFERLQTGQ